jgi:hypothetical protein
MWARTAELMIGGWLVLSPFIFRGTESIGELSAVHFAAGSAVVTFSLVSFWERTAHAHLLTAALAAGLVLYAYFGWERPGPPAAQNAITVGLLLVLLAIIPNDASRPPKPWRKPSGADGT